MGSPAHPTHAILSDRIVGWSTEQVLTILLSGLIVGPDDLMALAARIEAGGPLAGDRRRSLGAGPVGSAEVEWRIVAALELARRAGARPRPGVLRGPDDVAALAERALGGRAREAVLVIVCDAGNRPIDEVVVASGSVDQVAFPIREILHGISSGARGEMST